MININEKEIRAMAGLAYCSFECLIKGETAEALEVLGNLTKRLMGSSGIDFPPSVSQIERLMEEALEYLKDNPMPDELMW